MLWHLIDWYGPFFWISLAIAGFIAIAAAWHDEWKGAFSVAFAWLVVMAIFGGKTVVPVDPGADVPQQVAQGFRWFNEEGHLVLFELFVIGTFPFWALIVAEVFFLFFAVARRRGGWGFISLLAFALALQLFGNVPIFQWIWHHPWESAYILGIYVLGAAPWGLGKWLLFVRNNSIRTDQLLDRFFEAHPTYSRDGLSATQKIEWLDYFNAHSYEEEVDEYVKIEYDPDPKKHKADIMTWMMFWPWSVLWTILNDPIRALIRNLYYYISGWLETIRNYYWKDKRKYMPTQEELRANNKW